MSKIRIYELAKELGVENKDIIAKAVELGVVNATAKVSHSSSLSSDEADVVRRNLIREAIGKSPDSEFVRTKLDEKTGESRTVVERRKGDVIRRRKTDEAETPPPAAAAPAAPAEPIVETPALDSRDPRAIADDLFRKPSEKAIEQEEPEVVEEAVSEPEEVAAAATEDEDDAKKVGPRVLGKIDLPQKRVKPAVKAKEVTVEPEFGTSGQAAVARKDNEEEEEDEDGERQRARKKRSRRVEISRIDLVDYEARPLRRLGGKPTGKKGGKGRDDIELSPAEAKAEIGAQKASKRVIKMGADVITVGELGRQMSAKVSDVISKLMQLGVMATINQAIDVDTATIVADEFGYQLEFTGFDEGGILEVEGVDDPDKMTPRSPVVTVMGHVDHGKTSLLDKIRQTSTAQKEHGGITQHIGASVVVAPNGKSITFIDTPGHSAFTQMRARGAQVTDIVVLVVAADDGVMPQTIEALNHAKAANVPVIVAVNKIDKHDSQPERIKKQLAEHSLQAEDWGGDTIFCPVSALTGQGVPELLESILLVAEVKELKANTECRVKGTILEARQERGRGTVATVLVQAGTLRIGDIFISGPEYGRIRSMRGHDGAELETAGPATPVEITGLSGIPASGDDFIVVESDAKAKQVALNRKQVRLAKEQLNMAGGPISLEEFSRRATEEQAAEMNIILKADVQGSLQAVTDALTALAREKVRVRVIHAAVGGVIESDVHLAMASSAIIIGFGVRAEARAMEEAESLGIDVRFYRIIYELLDEVKLAMAGLLAPIRHEVPLARVEVRDTFSIPKIGIIAGCFVVDGTVKRGALMRLVRDSKVVHEGKMLALRRFKDDVREVASGYECGISFEGYNDIKSGDVIEVFEVKEVAATLD